MGGLSLAAMVLCLTCKEPYVAPAIKANNNLLVVDGFLHLGQDSTIIKLSRTRSLLDTGSGTPELNAQVSVEGQGSDMYPLVDQGNGIYVIPQLNLNSNEKYRLKIITASASQYASDFVVVKQSPPIDSLFWQLQDDGVHIYLSTHDPQNNTRYYRWQFIETWEYHSAYESNLKYDTASGGFENRKPDEYIYYCWKTVPSSAVVTGSSANLEQDLIFRAPITIIALNSQRIGIEYSILVLQQSLTADGLTYWENQKKNSQDLGTVFAPEPVELTGNIHSLDHPDEKVIGFISASSFTRRRLSISNNSLTVWDYELPKGCEIFTGAYYDFYFSHLGYIPISLDLVHGLRYSTGDCVDCRLEGGVNVKPAFWP